ncbi:hypothetical protein L9F63_014425, partial [Diploptera punctata]
SHSIKQHFNSNINRKQNMELNIYLTVTVIFTMLTNSEVDGAVALKLVDLHPDHPGKCYDPSTQRAYTVGESWSVDGHCLQNHCSDVPYNKLLSIHISGCGLVVAPPFCRTTPEDITKPYPDCCPHIVCFK